MILDLTLGASVKVKALTVLLSVLEVWNVKLAYRKSCVANLLVILDLTLGDSFKVKEGSITFKWT